MPNVVALIPARSGSQRVADKNVRPLSGHPTIAFTIAAAKASGVFDAIVVSTDSERYAAIARHYGAEVPALRPAELATAISPDIDWVRHIMQLLKSGERVFDAFSILRPTSPFRLPETIRRAWAEFRSEDGVDSLRAVEKVSQHPGKMWVIRGRRMSPLLPLTPAGQPWHSTQMAALPDVFVQNASLEIAWSRVAENGTIAGDVVMPFLTGASEGLDVNTERDFSLCEQLAERGEAKLPEVTQEPFFG